MSTKRNHNALAKGHFESREILELWVCDLLQFPGRIISYKKIAYICGVSHPTVITIAKKHGLQRGET